jgi:hypothetical protein
MEEDGKNPFSTTNALITIFDDFHKAPRGETFAQSGHPGKNIAR